MYHRHEDQRLRQRLMRGEYGTEWWNVPEEEEEEGDDPDFEPGVRVELLGNLAPETVIWRYMHLAAFLELAHARRLFLIRADHFNDALEGAYDWTRLEVTRRLLRAVGLPLQKRIETEYGRHYPYIEHSVPTIIHAAREMTYLSCWSEFDTESFAMWNTYGGGGESVAISTTVGRLADVLEGANYGEYGRATFQIGRVSYDPVTGPIYDPRVLFFHKRRYFNTEKEVRVVTTLQPFDPEQPIGYAHAVPTEVRLDSLVEEIVLAPGMREGVIAAVEGFVRSVGDASAITVRKSALDLNPLPAPE